MLTLNSYATQFVAIDRSVKLALSNLAWSTLGKCILASSKLASLNVCSTGGGFRQGVEK